MRIESEAVSVIEAHPLRDWHGGEELPELALPFSLDLTAGVET